MSNNFRYQSFVVVSEILGEKVAAVDHALPSHEQEFYPTTSLDVNCIEFEVQTNRNYNVDLRLRYLALKLRFDEGRGYETYNTKTKSENSKKFKQNRMKKQRNGGGARGFSSFRYKVVSIY